MTITQLTLIQVVNIGLFGFLFGIFETFTNTFYLFTNNLTLPRIQHGRELPAGAEDKVVRRKVIQMLVLGILLITIALLSVLITPEFFIIGVALIFLNGLLDYGKFRKINALVIWNTLSVISIILFVI